MGNGFFIETTKKKGERNMIHVRDFEPVMRDLGEEYFVSDIRYVDDLRAWADKEGEDLGEPLQPMKLISTDDNNLVMMVQDWVDEDTMQNLLNGLSVRWSMKDNVSDPEKVLNSSKKQLSFLFLKEYARTVKNVGGDDMIEDEWAVRELEKLGFFNE